MCALAVGDINYSAFIQAIDDEYTAQVIEVEHKLEGTALSAKEGVGGSGEGVCGQVDVDMLVGRIREHVDINRIRVRRGGKVVKGEGK